MVYLHLNLPDSVLVHNLHLELLRRYDETLRHFVDAALEHLDAFLERRLRVMIPIVYMNTALFIDKPDATHLSSKLRPK